MPASFFVTYDVVTPESAEHGDTAENGYALPGGWRFPADTVIGKPAEIAAVALRLGAAIDMLGCLENSSDGFTYYECDGTTDYRTGAETRLAFHVPHNATPSTVARIARLLKARRLI